MLIIDCLEIWTEFIDNYYISNYGNIYDSLKKKNVILTINNKGYLYYNSYINKKRKIYFPHRLVGIHFIDNPNKYPQINHIDGNKTNNHVDNLEWCTQKHNTRHAVSKGLINTATQGGKPVIQMSLDGEYINSFLSISDAARNIKGSNEHIGNVCRGKGKTAYGYIWKFK